MFKSVDSIQKFPNQYITRLIIDNDLEALVGKEGKLDEEVYDSFLHKSM